MADGYFSDFDKQLHFAKSLWQMYRSSSSLIGTPALEAKIEAAHDRIKSASKNRRLTVAWSGGKDSVVVAHLASQHSNVADPFIISNYLEFPDVEQFIVNTLERRNIVRLPFDVKWLSRTPGMLWSVKESVEFMRRAKWSWQDRYTKERSYHGIIFGRRTRDSKVVTNGRLVGGNSVGTGGCYTARNGITRVNPIYDWTTAEVFAYIRQHRLALYPPYYYGCFAVPIGIVYGTSEGWHQWLPYTCAIPDPKNAWRVIRDHADRRVLEQCSQHFPLARIVLRES